MNVERIPASELFVTDEFRGSRWIKDLCEKIGKVWTTWHPMPPGHFGTYFGAMQRRKYDNPWVQDLYALHECTHVATLTYDPSRAWADWCRAMVRSEMEASLASECFVYLRIPALRKLTFRHEIWFDRFRPEGENVWANEVPDMERRIRKERLRALNAPNFDDYLEHQIHNYSQQNMRWCVLWSKPVGGRTPFKDDPAFRLVEAHMASPSRDAEHAAWIKELTDSDGSETAPFIRQAMEFREVYKTSGDRFGNWVFAR